MPKKPTSIPASNFSEDELSKSTPTPPSDAGIPLTVAGDDERIEKIRQAAYARSEQRGFESGHEDEDWLAAEAEVDALEAPSSKQA